ncbi:patatin-like phospholipase family protein [Gilvimarinus sp. SDUM040013]|uniref:Patatin-like phospholipase family protein n=1 Tax=Gilvimarinus gilvus TaxID=3058038 RepID=A0ABU4RV14_9GAMM|nr:patatin-like phospholipase family protein [Gilvimarinus sp. SDUM040013]MDO3387917.1 patatin-like phospholipase family protein [Gilvimarinus sp. SDUM040013]MDX6848712.1 patatin-like phospholipase family protein [Gilvimarinus sp. SDUM040013]
MTLLKPTIALLALALATTAQADEPPRHVCQTENNRPCVALVLGGGGAKGGAHIGVIRALEENQIPVDLVVGTSIGSFVGALYASGKSADEIAQLFQNTDWDLGYKDDVPRQQIPNRRKRQMDQFPIQLDLGVGREGLKLPQGLLQGQGMKVLIDQLLGTHVLFDSFDDLPIPFRAVAADIETGEQVILQSGDLSTALQISMSLPGIVRPIEHEGRLLVDGGIANNLPISVAQSLGADVVIAVDVGSPAATREELGSGLSILRQLTSFLTTQNTEQQLQRLTETDIYIRPKLEGVTLLSFDKIDLAEDAGYSAANEVLTKHQTAHTLAGTGTPRDNETFLAADNALTIDRILLTNQSRLSDDLVLQRLGIIEGSAYTPNDIQQGMQRLYGQGTIARVRTSLSRGDEANTLNALVEEKEWGPGYMDFKLSFEDNLKSQSQYQLGASYRRTNLSPYGAEWYSTFEFGTEKKFTSELYWPIKTSGFFWQGSAQYERDVFSYQEQGESLGEVIENDYRFDAGIGWNALDRLDLISGYFHNEGDVRLPVLLAELTDISEFDYSQSGGFARLEFDSLDHPSFPSSGWQFGAQLTRSRIKLLEVADDSTQVELGLIGAYSLGRHSLRGQLEYKSTTNDDPLSVVGTHEIGGFLHLSGNEIGFLSGQQTRFASIVYTYEIAENNFRLFNFPLFLGTSLEAGNAWNDRTQVDYSDLIHSGSLFLGWDSPVGPAYLAWGNSDTGNQSVYIFMGVVF